MPTIEKWRWRLKASTTGKLYTTRHLMTEAEALAQDPAAERLPHSRVVIDAGAVPLVTPRQSQARPLPGDNP
jgi:hypothetical protein